uniref:Uncharacterized protein n=1 Tax=Anguilla anguilla TaxID=7936 RepID=A0A0E9TQR2_ANGAN
MLTNTSTKVIKSLESRLDIEGSLILTLRNASVSSETPVNPFVPNNMVPYNGATMYKKCCNSTW